VPAERSAGAGWSAPLRALYDVLTVPSDPRAADAIFVFAGRHERKEYGLELWRRGVAPILLLSVGRYEWRRTLAMGLPSTGNLRDLVDSTPPVRRHFVLALGPDGARAEWMARGRLGTRSEARELSRIASVRGLRSVLVVSSAPHLRRVAISLRRALDPAVARSFAAVPEERSSVRREDWWRHRAGWSLVAAEYVKLPVYALLPRA
jgi:uncharacterized SAM-binding protein YcdF (DUF218 family)